MIAHHHEGRRTPLLAETTDDRNLDTQKLCYFVFGEDLWSLRHEAIFGSWPKSAIEVEGLSIQQVGDIAAGRESRIHLIL